MTDGLKKYLFGNVQTNAAKNKKRTGQTFMSPIGGSGSKKQKRKKKVHISLAESRQHMFFFHGHRLSHFAMMLTN